jgi:hypothetical protein
MQKRRQNIQVLQSPPVATKFCDGILAAEVYRWTSHRSCCVGLVTCCVRMRMEWIHASSVNQCTEYYLKKLPFRGPAT